MPAIPSTDEELVLRCRSGDRAAFDALVERYRGVAYNLALQRMHDPESAADVTQQALVEAYCSLPSLREPEKFSGWLRGITAHVCADQYAREARVPRADADLPAPAAPDPLHELQHEEVRRTVREAVGQLASATRLAMNLFYFDGLSCREVADFCGVSVSAIKSRLHEGREAMRKGNVKMGDKTERTEAAPQTIVAYSGEDTVDVLFWKRPHRKELYGAMYPAVRRDDKAFWEQWRHVTDLETLLKLWLNTGVLVEEGGELVCQVPLYTTPHDDETFVAWHARTSRAVSQRICDSDDELRGLQEDLRCSEPDPVNLRFITVLGRLIANGLHAALERGLLGSASDWGGLGSAFIFGGRGRNLPPTGGYSINTRGGPPHALFKSFQADGYPGDVAFYPYGSGPVVAALAQLAARATSRAEFLDTIAPGAGASPRAEEVLQQVLAARWVEEHGQELQLCLPWLPWSVSEDAERLRALAERVCEPIAEAAPELRALASQCSFARCRFTDTAYLLTSIMIGHVVRDLQRKEVICKYPMPIPPGFGAWLYVTSAE